MVTYHHGGRISGSYAVGQTNHILNSRNELRGCLGHITRWVNLGAGSDSADAKWKSHITNVGEVHRRDHLRDIQTAFEDQAGVSVEELTADNGLKLFSRRQNRVVCRGSYLEVGLEQAVVSGTIGTTQIELLGAFGGLTGVKRERYPAISGMYQLQESILQLRMERGWLLDRI